MGPPLGEEGAQRMAAPAGPSSQRVNQTVLLRSPQPSPIRESKITIFTASAAKPGTKQDE